MSPKVKKLLTQGFGSWIDLDSGVPCSRYVAKRAIEIMKLISQTDSYSEFMLKITIKGKIGKRWMPSVKVYDIAKRNYMIGFVNVPSIYEQNGEDPPKTQTDRMNIKLGVPFNAAGYAVC